MSLFLLTAAALVVARQSGDVTEPRLMRTPSIHGDTVVFSYAGDLWVTKTKGDELARRLTSHPGLEIRPKISPDGNWVAFTGMYDGATNIYLIPIDGGEPKRLTYDAEGDACLGWTPDGKIAYSSIAGNFTNRQPRLWLIDPRGGMPVSTKINEVGEVSFFPDGKAMAYNRLNSYLFNWRHYRGGSQGRISFYNFGENKYSELPSKREQSYFPMIVGRDVYFISDKGTGVLNLFAYNMDRKTEVQLTKYTDADIRYPSTDGKTIVFDRDGYLYTYDIASHDIERMHVRIASENLIARPSLRPLGGQITSMGLSPSGVRLAVEARGRIFSVPAKHGDTRPVTNEPGSRARFGQWAPDGKTIAYMSDATGQYEIYTRPQEGGPATQLTTSSPFAIDHFEYLPDGKSIGIYTVDNKYVLLDLTTKQLKTVIESRYGIQHLDVSPDSKWIAYTEGGSNRFASLYLYEIATGKRTRVTNGHFDEGDVAFDLNGKYLYLVSARTFSPGYGSYEFSLKVENTQKVYVIPLAKDTPNPLIVPDDEEPAKEGEGARPPRPGGPGGPASGGSPSPDVKIDLDGLGSRLIALPVPASEYSFVVGSKDGVFYPHNGTLMRYDVGAREASEILSSTAGALTFNQNHTKIAYNIGGVLGVVDAHPGNQVGQGRVDTGSVEAVIDPRQEWNQIFWEAWRFEKDHYYDKDMRGLNWLTIGKHYSEYLKYVNDRWDLTYVLGLMLGELGTSHSYVAGGDLGIGIRAIPIGHLGADYETSGNSVRFKKVYKGLTFDASTMGPLANPGVNVNEGDYLLEIDGQAVDSHTNPDSLMLDKVGKGVTITVNSTPTLTGARKVRVFPIASEMELRYTEFVQDCDKKVTELSSGRIGYMHIRDTATNGAIDFIRGFYPQVDKDALIVDERWNGGGFIQPWFVDTLARKVKAMIQQRNGVDEPEEAAVMGPKAMLINGYAGSGGDFFPWMFKQAHLGPLIGMRTWGGLVGIGAGAPLVDGGTVTSPAFSIYDPSTNEIIAENHGIDPDIEVDARPDLIADGQDPQLEAAVKYLLQQLAHVRPNKERTTLPHVNKDGTISP